MNEMVERVARASFVAWSGERKNGKTFEDMPTWEREWCLNHARAMIEAMREPTVEMLVAAYAIVGIPERPVLANGYRAMIDEALK